MKIDHNNRLYIIDEGSGYSCLGFDVMDGRASRLAKELGRFWDKYIPDGFVKYSKYQELLTIARERFTKNGTRCGCELHPDLIEAWESRKRVEVTFSDGHKERFRVALSTGYIPCYLKIKNSNSIGGEAISYDEKIAYVRRLP